MDEELKKIMGVAEMPAGNSTRATTLKFADDTSGRLEITRGEEGATPRGYTLKALSDLYELTSHATDPDQPVDPQSHHYAPLFLTIEEEIVRSDNCEPGLTDGAVGLSLDMLQMDPDANVQHDVVARRIQLSLRMCLSLNPYTRREVRQALRKIGKSVNRHTRVAGRRGYLDFIREYIPV